MIRRGGGGRRQARSKGSYLLVGILWSGVLVLMGVLVWVACERTEPPANPDPADGVQQAPIPEPVVSRAPEPAALPEEPVVRPAGPGDLLMDRVLAMAKKDESHFRKELLGYAGYGFTRMGRTARAVELRTLARDETEKNRVAFHVARAHAEQGAFEGALAAMSSVSGPDEPEKRIATLVSMLAKEGQHKMAFQIARRMPDSAARLRGLAGVFFHGMPKDGALEKELLAEVGPLVREAPEGLPHHVWDSLAGLLSKEEVASSEELAVIAAQQSLKAIPADADKQTRIGIESTVVYHLARAGRFDLAEEIVLAMDPDPPRRAKIINSGRAWSMRTIADALFERGEIETALKWLDRAGKDPRQVGGFLPRWFSVAVAHARAGPADQGPRGRDPFAPAQGAHRPASPGVQGAGQSESGSGRGSHGGRGARSAQTLAHLECDGPRGG